MEGVNDDIVRFSLVARLDGNKPVWGVALWQGKAVKDLRQSRRYSDGKIRQATDIADETAEKIHFDNMSGFPASAMT